MRPAATLRARAGIARSKLRDHKRAMREHRRGAQEAAAELAEIEAECAARGIALVLAPVPGPGRSPDTGRA